ncbi:MAG: hypothetical protein ACE5IY_22415 [bacterium]
MVLAYAAAGEIHEFLTANEIPYVIIGGIANQRWGKPLLTRDVGDHVPSAV